MRLFIGGAGGGVKDDILKVQINSLFLNRVTDR